MYLQVSRQVYEVGMKEKDGTEADWKSSAALPNKSSSIAYKKKKSSTIIYETLQKNESIFYMPDTSGDGSPSVNRSISIYPPCEFNYCKFGLTWDSVWWTFSNVSFWSRNKIFIQTYV